MVCHVAKRILFLVALLASPAALAEPPLAGTSVRLVPQAGTIPSGCSGTGKPCIWFDSVAGAFKLRNTDGTDTTGVLSLGSTTAGIADSFGPYTHTLSLGAVANQTFLKIAMGDPGRYSDFLGTVTSNPNANFRDDVVMLGPNCGPGAAPIVSGRGAICDSWEGYFSGSNHQQERHIETIDPAGTLTREVSILASDDSPNYATTLMLQYSATGTGGTVVIQPMSGSGSSIGVTQSSTTITAGNYQLIVGTTQALLQNVVTGARWVVNGSNLYFGATGGIVLDTDTIVMGGPSSRLAELYVKHLDSGNGALSLSWNNGPEVAHFDQFGLTLIGNPAQTNGGAGLNFADGSALAVSASATGSIRYNNTSHIVEESLNAAAWEPFGRAWLFDRSSTAQQFGTNGNTADFLQFHSSGMFIGNGSAYLGSDGSLVTLYTASTPNLQVGGGSARLLNSTLFYPSNSTDTGTRPTCDSTKRNALWIADGATGVTDSYQACLKSAANTYSWVTIGTGG